MTALEELAKLESEFNARQSYDVRLSQRAEMGYGRKYCHPLKALFLAMALPPRIGMRLVSERGGLIADTWERVPDIDEVSWGEVIAIFEAAKARLNPAWCDVWISSIKSKVQNS